MIFDPPALRPGHVHVNTARRYKGRHLGWNRSCLRSDLSTTDLTPRRRGVRRGVARGGDFSGRERGEGGVPFKSSQPAGFYVTQGGGSAEEDAVGKRGLDDLAARGSECAGEAGVERRIFLQLFFVIGKEGLER